MKRLVATTRSHWRDGTLSDGQIEAIVATLRRPGGDLPGPGVSSSGISLR